MPNRTCSVPDCGKPHRARGYCATHYNDRFVTVRHPVHSVPCTVCGVVVVRRVGARHRPTCSVQCRQRLEYGDVELTPYRWDTDAVRRARKAGADVVEVFDRVDIFERDGWTCHICGEPTDKDAPVFDPKSATVDHIVPLSRGGKHSMANVACAHLGCNSAKQDRA